MAAIVRNSMRFLRSTQVTLATADDLDGTQDGSQWYNITGCARVLITQDNSGTAGTAGIDVIEISRDGGKTWAADTTLLAMSADDTTGTVLNNGALNAAGVEPTRYTSWTAGPYDGPTAIRCTRKVADNASSAAWVTGAPAVYMTVFGGRENGGAPSTTVTGA